MPVDPDTFIDDASARLGEDRAATVAIVEAVLTTLGQRLTYEQARKLAATLPRDLGAHLMGSKAGQGFNRQAFLERVAEQVGSDAGTAEDQVATVLSMVGEVVPATELGKVRDQLPDDLAALLGPMPGRREPESVKQEGGAYDHQSTDAQAKREGKDSTPRYGKQGAN